MSPEEMADRLAVQQNVTDFADALDLKRWDLLDRVFAPDARIAFGGTPLRAAEAAAWLRRIYSAPALRACLHMVGNMHIRLAGDAAESLTRVFVPLELLDGDQARLGLNGVWYAWRHARTAEGWRITGSLDRWAPAKPAWQPGFYGWVSPPYDAHGEAANVQSRGRA